MRAPGAGVPKHLMHIEQIGIGAAIGTACRNFYLLDHIGELRAHGPIIQVVALRDCVGLRSLRITRRNANRDAGNKSGVAHSSFPDIVLLGGCVVGIACPGQRRPFGLRRE